MSLPPPHTHHNTPPHTPSQHTHHNTPPHTPSQHTHHNPTSHTHITTPTHITHTSQHPPTHHTHTSHPHNTHTAFTELQTDLADLVHITDQNLPYRDFRTFAMRFLFPQAGDDHPVLHPLVLPEKSDTEQVDPLVQCITCVSKCVCVCVCVCVLLTPPCACVCTNPPLCLCVY